ncbi:MAG: ribonuclease HIII [Nanoarchaeota archaeon]|nr:ribonuclease HIII [Nanoarchaeota archaeon]
MGGKITFKNETEAYKVIKKALTKKGYEVDDHKKIQYGLQFFICSEGKKELIRIYGGKKGTKLDLSQVKNISVKDDILSIIGISPELKEGDSASKTHGKVYSLCVGINTFSDSCFLSLDYAGRDAEELHHLLLEKFGIGEGTIKLVNGEATYREITEAIQKIKKIAKKEDTILIFFATHGEFVKVGSDVDFYLIASDSDSNNLMATALAMKTLKTLVSQIPAEKKLIFLDSCHSGGICRRDRSEISLQTKGEVFQNFSSEDFVIITSCLENENSHEEADFHHGVFTYYLLSGLTGAVEAKGGLIDLYTLFVYINRFVKGYVNNIHKRSQTPKFFGNLKGPFLLPKLKDLNRPIKNGDLREFTITPLDNNAVKLKFETINCIGIDESGKGDYFGPLAVAGVYVDTEAKIEQLRSIGVRDCKKIPDSRVMLMAKRIGQICDHEVVFILPPKYNELYSRMANLNEILAWAHAQSLEQLLTRNQECDIAISDQFAWKDILINKLKQRGKKIQVIQRPKAEENIAVAAASILARAKFLDVLSDMKRRFKHDFSKGCNDRVKGEAVDFLKKGGDLKDIAKIHFKTTKEVIGKFEKQKKK